MTDNCVYMRSVDNIRTIIFIWVDDINIAASSNDILNSVKRSLCNRFKMKDLGQLSWFLGMEFKFENGYISVGQQKYLDKMLDRFNITDCN